MRTHRAMIVCAVVVFTGCTTLPETGIPRADADTIRVATFNTALSRPEPDALARALADGEDENIKLVAETLQRTRPDIVLLQEFDYDPTGQAYDGFQRNYLDQPQNGAEPIDYPYRYAPSVNTGQPSGVDLDNDGRVEGPGDALGWGNYPGHYGMVVLSKYPIRDKQARTFRALRWQDYAPNHLDQIGLYSDKAREVLRLSSKTHADLVVEVNGEPLHLLISHPSPPVFDGPEDRNGYRNADEIMLWFAYLTPTNRDAVLTDDQGRTGPLDGDARFVLLGDLNADPFDGESRDRVMARLLSHPRINTALTPGSEGAADAARSQGGANLKHAGNARYDTTDWDDGENGPGNLRVDYALPSDNLRLIDAGVFWPVSGGALHHLNGASDHRLVWVDITFD
ncbi:MAG: endonuclease/exonuclease/phosphatase family protein [Planctomycetota bacterium]